MEHHHHHHPHTTANEQGRPEAERLLGISEKLLHNRDLTGSREFALLAQESDPLLEGSDQILAICDVLHASEKRVVNNRHHDWYAILQTNPLSLSSDPDLIKKNYRRLALLLHPDKNRYPLSDAAFKFVADAWAVLSDSSRRGLYDHEISVYDRVELRPQPPPQPQPQDKDKLPVRRSPRDGGVGDGQGQPESGMGPSPTPRGGSVTYARHRTHKADMGAEMRTKFWTACPYCYVLYEYPRGYEDCCLKCQNCERAYHATVIRSLPPLVPGREAYYCCWGFFPLGFSLENSSTGGKKNGVNNNNVNADNINGRNPNSVFPNWMPTGMFSTPVGGGGVPQGVRANLNVGGGGIDISDGGVGFGNNVTVAGYSSRPVGMGGTPVGAKKRGRPRKNP